MAEKEKAEAAIAELNGYSLSGSKLNVEVCIHKSDIYNYIRLLFYFLTGVRFPSIPLF